MRWMAVGVGVALAGLGAALFAPFAGSLHLGMASAAQAERKPNIIVILADDLGYADISAYGIKRINTPNIDRIGAEGIKFTDAYATAPVCGPSRAGLQTGRYPQRTGFEFNNGPARRDLDQGLGLSQGEITLAQALKAQGYRTGMVGKWHLGSQTGFYPTNRGYEEFVGILTGQTEYIDPKAPGVRTFAAADASEGAAVAAAAPRASLRGALNEVFEGPQKTVVRNEQQYLTDYFGERAFEFVRRSAPDDKPYFLYFAPTAPHAPFQVTQKYYDRFPQITDERLRIYAAMISALDDSVGRVLKAVEDSGEAADTLIYFMTDNGCAAYIPGICSCEPLRGGKLTHYEGGVRVPLMMRWPAKIQPSQVDRRVVSLLDIFPTSLAAAGGKLATDRAYDGVDLMPFLTTKRDGTPHDELVWRRSPLVSIRKGDWKLWKSVGAEYGAYTLLFNLKTDLNETTNLAEKNPEKVRELEADIARWAKDMQDPKWPSRPPNNYNVCGTPFVVPI